jgi:signal peptidase I
MTQNKSPGAKPRSSPASAGQSDKRDKRSADASSGSGNHLPSPAAIRELIESVAIAFVLAFLFRTFEAEAFVIPTGSMAPTLMGRHKDVICPKCHYPYQVSASDEVTPDNVLLGPEYAIESFTCPMCRYTAQVDDVKDKVSFNGDRILVSKLAYEIGEPQRWDVIVFKYPGDPPNPNVPPEQRSDSRINFIKRLVGLPGDTIRIQNGDVWVRSGKDKKKSGDKAKFVIDRRSPKKLLAMLQPVFDNDYMPPIAKDGWPVRWSPVSESAAGDWHTDDLASFSINGTVKGEKWLRYHHRVPPDDWQQTLRQQPLDLEPQLITDFTAYDTSKRRMYADPHRPGPNRAGIGSHWVGDLAVECVVETQSPDGTLALELCKGGWLFQCRFDLSTGQATLSISGKSDWKRTGSTSLRGEGKHKILFANCDDELRLWIDGSLVSFDGPTTYSDLNLDTTSPKTPADLEPVGIASAGAAMRVSHLRVLRDIYYIAVSSDLPGQEARDVSYQIGKAKPGEGTTPSPDVPYVEFDLKEDPLNPQEDQFFVLGDNSAMSKDGRLWGMNHKDYWVPRKLLIGKALLIYWPHSWDRLPYFNSIPCPYFPNFSRMGLIR